jgi:hypothetical protein
LDSRTVWVEQQISKSCIFPRENLYLGPGEYDPHLPESHVASPIIRPSCVSAGNDHPLRSHGAHQKTDRKRTPYQLSTDLGGLSCSRSEFASLFHDHDQRIAIDPSRRYYVSQQPFLPQDNFLAPILHDGRKKPGGSVIASQEYQRPPLKIALPEYDPQYDSSQLGHQPKYGSVPKTQRPELFGTPVDYSLPEGTVCQRAKTPAKNNSFTPIRRKVKTPTPLKSVPKLSTVFNTSCYDSRRKAAPPTLTPSYVNQQARVKVFSQAVLRPQSYQSQHVPSALGDRIKRNSMM